MSNDEIARCLTRGCVARAGHDGDHIFVAPQPARSCLEKRRYSTEAWANKVAADCFRERGTWLRVYACEICNGFHLTSMDVEVRPGWHEPKPSKRESAYERRNEQRGRRNARRRR